MGGNRWMGLLPLGICMWAVCSLPGCGSGGDTGGPPEEKRSSDPDCIGCHVDDYEGARHHASEKPKRCEVCHREDHWHPTVRKHAWPLTGAHENASCFSCHATKPPVYEGTSTACIACHRAEFEAENAKNPPHARSSEVCDKCHSTNDWSEWPGHPKGASAPPHPTATVSATAEPPKPTATTTVSKPPVPKKPTPRPTATAKPTSTAVPTAPAAPTPTPTATQTTPPIITGASRR